MGARKDDTRAATVAATLLTGYTLGYNLVDCHVEGEARMSSSTVRISRQAQSVLRELAQREGKPMQAILERAIESYRRERFLQEANRAYAALRQNKKAWAEEMTERKDWDQTLADEPEDR